MTELLEKKRKRSTSSRLTKKIAMDNAVVSVCFDGEDEKVYKIRWTELLTMDDELPFEEFDDLMLGTRVMAPWCASGDDRINFAEATVVENEKQSPHSGHRDKKKAQSLVGNKVKKACSKKDRTQSTKKSKIKVRSNVSRKKDEEILQLISHITPPLSSEPSDTITSTSPSITPVYCEPIATEPCNNTNHIIPVVPPVGDLPNDTVISPVDVQPNNNISSHISPVDSSVNIQPITTHTSPVNTQVRLQPSESITSDTSILDTPVSIDDISYTSPEQILPISPPILFNSMYTGVNRLNQNQHASKQYRSTSVPLMRPASSRLSSWHMSPSNYMYPTDMMEDDVSSISGFSSFSQSIMSDQVSSPAPSFGEQFPSTVHSSELQYVYKNWITPLKNQLSEMRFQLHRFMDNSVPEHWENKGQSTSSTNCCTSGDSTVATTETSILSDHSLPDPEHSQTGTYLGYANKEKYRVYAPNITASDVTRAEEGATDYATLGKKLLQVVFRNDLEERPHDICCTQSEGRELLDQQLLKGIRLHLHRKFCVKKGLKMFSAEEEKLWNTTLKKMNAHIRYKRSAKKTSS